MGYYDIQQVCLNGHQITDSYNKHPQFRKEYCDECGEKTIFECPNCNVPIRGDYHVEGVFGGGETSVPKHCYSCGKPYPWSKKTGINKIVNFEEHIIHTSIDTVSGKLFKDGHYKQAILEAFIAVIDRVKDVANHPTTGNGRELDGDDLMNQVFGCEGKTPIIKLNDLKTTADKDEQKGFMYMFKAICGLRNKKGHKNFVQNDPKITIEYLALCSLLMRLLDEEFIREYNN
ncbi:TIGR02391 family protein [Candidatus Peregrinibacteria bacterium]|nr:TIGR02391 family protein [Candidatus Peregrinibacteria bacterium]